MPRAVSFTCVLPRFVKLGPREVSSQMGSVKGFISKTSLFPSLVPTFPLRVACVGAVCKKSVPQVP